jgi:hypothetical protein
VSFSAGRFTVSGSERGIDLLAMIYSSDTETEMAIYMIPNGILARP